MNDYQLSVMEDFAAKLDRPREPINDYEIGHLLSQHKRLTAEVRRLRALLAAEPSAGLPKVPQVAKSHGNRVIEPFPLDECAEAVLRHRQATQE